MDNFSIQIASPYNREKLVVEILYREEIIAEINQEKEELEIEIYPSFSEKKMQFPLSKFQKILEEAKQHLLL